MHVSVITVGMPKMRVTLLVLRFRRIASVQCRPVRMLLHPELFYAFKITRAALCRLITQFDTFPRDFVDRPALRCQHRISFPIHRVRA